MCKYNETSKFLPLIHETNITAESNFTWKAKFSICISFVFLYVKTIVGYLIGIFDLEKITIT